MKNGISSFLRGLSLCMVFAFTFGPLTAATNPITGSYVIGPFNGGFTNGNYSISATSSVVTVTGNVTSSSATNTGQSLTSSWEIWARPYGVGADWQKEYIGTSKAPSGNISGDFSTGFQGYVEVRLVRDGTAEVSDFISDPGVADTYKVAINLTNTTQYPATFKYYRQDAGGVASATPTHTVTLQPGETLIGNFVDDEGPSTFSVFAEYAGVEELPGIGWVQDGSAVTDVFVEEVISVPVNDPQDDPPQADNTETPTNETNPEAPPAGENLATGQTTGETDVTVKNSTDPAQNLTEGVFESAIGQVIRAIRNNGTGSGGSGGNTTVNVDTSGIESRIDDTNTQLNAANNHLSGIALSLDTLRGRAEAEQTEVDAEQALVDATPLLSEMEALGGTASTQLQGQLPNADNMAPAAEVLGSAVDFSITLPATMGAATFDLDPFREDRLGPAISWFRSAVAWLVIIGFGAWVFQETRIIIADIPKLPQAKGNPVIGGTGAQGTALIAAAAITAIMATVVVGLVGWVFGDIGFAYILSTATTHPLAGMPAKAAWMLNQVFPVATMITALLGRISFNAWAMKYYAIASSLIRFIVT